MNKTLLGVLTLSLTIPIVSAQDVSVESALKDIANRGSAAAKTTKEIISPKYKRARELHKTHAAYLAKLAEGKTRPFPEIAEKWASYQRETKEASKLYKSFLETKSDDERVKLGKSLLDAVQPLGLVLRNASHGVVPEVVMSDALAAEQESLMDEFNALPTATDENNVNLMTPDVLYTLKHLPIPIQFSGPKDTVIMLQSEVGGNFPNGLDYFKLKTDENGLASTYWMSNGDGVAECQILYRSPELISKGRITAIVRQLNLVSLEAFSPVVKAAIDKAQSIK